MAVARVTKIVASSTKSFEDAVKEGVKRANKTIRRLTGLHVLEQKCKIEKEKIIEYRVTLEITFIIEET
ncbi:MAG: dodecin family protein [Planctomycetota bacterium]